jgi:hypothetical protein
VESVQFQITLRLDRDEELINVAQRSSLVIYEVMRSNNMKSRLEFSFE